MSTKLFVLFLGIFAVSATSQALNPGDTLVLLDNLAIRESHSIFFKGLQGRYLIENAMPAFHTSN